MMKSLSVTGATFTLLSIALSCGGGTPTDECNKIVNATCSKIYLCVDAATIKTTLGYTSQSDCVTKLESSSNCSTAACPQGRTYNSAAADTCANDINNEACNQATSAPPSCSNICQ